MNIFCTGTPWSDAWSASEERERATSEKIGNPDKAESSPLHFPLSPSVRSFTLSLLAETDSITRDRGKEKNPYLKSNQLLSLFFTLNQARRFQFLPFLPLFHIFFSPAHSVNSLLGLQRYPTNHCIPNLHRFWQKDS